MDRRVREEMERGVERAGRAGSDSGSSYSISSSRNLEEMTVLLKAFADALSANGSCSSSDTMTVRAGGGGGARRFDVGMITDVLRGLDTACQGCIVAWCPETDTDDAAVMLAGEVRKLEPEPRPRGERETLGRCTKARACGDEMADAAEGCEKLNGFPNPP